MQEGISMIYHSISRRISPFVKVKISSGLICLMQRLRSCKTLHLMLLTAVFFMWQSPTGEASGHCYCGAFYVTNFSPALEVREKIRRRRRRRKKHENLQKESLSSNQCVWRNDTESKSCRGLPFTPLAWDGSELGEQEQRPFPPQPPPRSCHLPLVPALRLPLHLPRSIHPHLPLARVLASLALLLHSWRAYRDATRIRNMPLCLYKRKQSGMREVAISFLSLTSSRYFSSRRSSMRMAVKMVPTRRDKGRTKTRMRLLVLGGPALTTTRLCRLRRRAEEEEEEEEEKLTAVAVGGRGVWDLLLALVTFVANAAA